MPGMPVGLPTVRNKRGNVVVRRRRIVRAGAGIPVMGPVTRTPIVPTRGSVIRFVTGRIPMILMGCVEIVSVPVVKVAVVAGAGACSVIASVTPRRIVRPIWAPLMNVMP